MPVKPVSDPEYLQKLQDYYAKNQAFPSYAGIADIVGLKAKSAASALMGRLQTAGYVVPKQGRWIPGPRFFDRSLMSSKVAAGLPAMAFEAPSDGLAIDAHLIGHPSKTFLLTIKGESMSDIGLMPNDTLVVERSHVADDGDIVIAFVDDGYTVKRLIREGRKYVLKPENKAFPILRPDPLEIVGIVVGSFRKYRK